MPPEDREQAVAAIKKAVERFGQRKLSRTAGVSRNVLDSAVDDKDPLSDQALIKLGKATKKLRDNEDAKSERDAKLLAQVRDRVAKEGIRGVAQAAGIDGGNLSRLLRGRRSASSRLLVALIKASDSHS